VLRTSAYIAVTLAMTWPYGAHAGDALVKHWAPDPALVVWITRWVQHAIITDPSHFFDANIFYPFHNTLTYSENGIPTALLAAPVFLLTNNAITANTFVVLGSFVIAALGMDELVYHLTRNRSVSILAGLAFAFLPYRFAHMWNVYQLGNAWTPWVILAVFILIERQTLRWSLIVGLVVAIQALTSIYLAFQILFALAIVIIVALAADRRTHSWKFAAHLAIAAVVAALLTLPPYLPYLGLTDQGGARTITESDYWKADLESYTRKVAWDEQPSPANTPADHDAQLGFEASLYPGTFALLGALIALVGFRRRKYPTIVLSLIGLTGLLLSLGPSLGPRPNYSLLDGWTNHGRSSFFLPYRFLFDNVSLFRAMRVPARFGALTDFAAVGLAGFGWVDVWDRLGIGKRNRSRMSHQCFRFSSSMPHQRFLSANAHHQMLAWGLAIALAIPLLADLHTGPVPIEKIDMGDAAAAPYDWLAHQPNKGPIMEFPALSIPETPSWRQVHGNTAESMIWSTRQWRPLVNGYSGFFPTNHVRLVNAFSTNILRPNGTSARVSHIDPNNATLLQQLRVQYVVVHRNEYSAEDWPTVVSQLNQAADIVKKVAEFDDAAVYRVAPLSNAEERLNTTLLVPTMGAPRAAWRPRVIIRNPNHRSLLLVQEQPIKFNVSWHDNDGRLVRHDSVQLDMPTVLRGDQLVCSLGGCQATVETSNASTLTDHPDSGGGLFQPAPGKYQVRVEITGMSALATRCTVDVEIRPTIVDDHANRWWACDQTVDATPALVEAPYAATPTFLRVDGQLTISTVFVSPADAEIQAWFFLSRPGSLVPWSDFIQQSHTVRHLVRKDRATEFGWVEPLDVPDGVYDLTVWFQRRENGEWTHELGGNLGLGPVVIARNRPVSGPFQLVSWGVPAPVAPGHQAVVRLAVQGSSSTERCLATWTLREQPHGETPGKALAWGQSPDCGAVRPRVPEGLAPGRYVLEIVAIAAGDEEVQRSDRIVQDLVVVDWFGW
jgi:hypothetical protein